MKCEVKNHNLGSKVRIIGLKLIYFMPYELILVLIKLINRLSKQLMMKN